MKIIGKKALVAFWSLYPNAETPLKRWEKITSKASCENLAETRRDFPHADAVGVCTIFNIKGNNYRLITKIYYASQTVLVRFVLTHQEYDRNKWKGDCGC